ncbi:class I SAM-dependent methyltransferase [Finegoldia sp. BIOML-A1]|uniref:class I SAM-dependent methyltransferase n=1 Tax=Finegoldia sp. BIOML-A1 TaxID=2584649 RepID=UPI0012B0D6D4|nr:class I SAM-dependent methyltransferase [Finegoldia sp. BIOML-A1]MSB10448.1 methyltransferase [Finegoldia sp. BIOML-A1]
MKVSNLLICGNPENLHYLQAKTKLCILDSEDELAEKNAYFKNLKLYKFVSQLPSDIKWAYIPQKSLIASNNPYLRMELLEAGISIVDQMPLDVDQIKDCVKIANNKKVYYIPEIPSENDIFFKQCTNTIYEEFSKNNILYIDGLFSKFLIYYIFKILKEGLKTNQKVNITNNHGNSMIKSFSGYIASVPFCIRIYRPNLNEEYQFTAYNDELKIFTKNCCITINFIQKNILYGYNIIKKTAGNISGFNQTLKNNYKLNLSTVIEEGIDINEINYRSHIQEALNDLSFIQDINKVLSCDKMTGIGEYKRKNNWFQTLKQGDGFNYNNSVTINMSKEIANIERNYSYISKEYLLKYKETLDTYILGEIFKFFKDNGAFNDQNIKYSEEKIIKNCFHSKNSKIVKRWLKMLVLHGFIENNEGSFYLTKNLQINTEQLFCELRELWDWKLGDPSSIDYIRENIKNLKELFYGEIDCNAILFPEADIKYATALYKNNLIYRFLNEIIGIQVADYVNRHFESKLRKITILEVGAGIGASTDSIITKLNEYSLIQKINYLYTDISKFFLDIGKEKFKNNSAIKYLRLNIDNLEEIESLDKVDIIVAAGVLNNSSNLEKVMKAFLKKIRPDGVMLITEPIGNPIEMLVSQVFMMEEPDDIRKIKNSTFLELNDWIELINRCGDFDISIFPRENFNLNIFGQKLLIIKDKVR